MAKGLEQTIADSGYTNVTLQWNGSRWRVIAVDARGGVVEATAGRLRQALEALNSSEDARK